MVNINYISTQLV